MATVSGDGSVVGLHRRVRELEALHRAASLFLEHTDPSEVALTTVSVFAGVLHAPRCRLYRWGVDGPVFVAECVEGSAAAAPRDSDGPPLGAAGRKARTAPSAFLDLESGRLVAPLRSGSAAIGVLVAEQPAAQSFEPDHLRAADGIAALAAPALRNAAELDRLASANTELRSVSRVQGECLDVASSELRASLTVLMGYLSLVEDGALGALPEQVSTAMPVIDSRLAAMQVLTDALQDTACLDDGRLTLNLTDADLREVVDEAVRRCEVFVASGQRLALRCPKQPMPVHVDRDRTLHIVSTLVHNVLRRSSAQDDVECDLEIDGEMASFAVCDRRLRLDARDDVAPFAHVRTGEPAGTRGASWTGVGLHIARELARAHGGDITVDANGDEGCTFRVLLPLAR